jgi:hypothetical protein
MRKKGKEKREKKPCFLFFGFRLIFFAVGRRRILLSLSLSWGIHHKLIRTIQEKWIRRHRPDSSLIYQPLTP